MPMQTRVSDLDPAVTTFAGLDVDKQHSCDFHRLGAIGEIFALDAIIDAGD